MFSALFAEKGPTAETWWGVFRQARPDDGPAETLRRVEEAVTGKPSASDARVWAGEAEASSPQSPEERAARFTAASDVLLAAGLEDEAKACLQRGAAVSSDAGLFAKAGDLDAGKLNWADAADEYARAAAAAPDQPAFRYLAGWAAARSGDRAAGERDMAVAREIPLANDHARAGLAAVLRKHGLDAAADEEEALFPRLSGFNSPVLEQWASRRAEAMAAAGDYAQAAALAKQATLCVYGKGVSFVNEGDMLRVPAALNRYKAQAALKAGDTAAALVALRRVTEATPGDTEIVIAFYPELRRRGLGTEADALLANVTGLYRSLLARHPGSSMLHNDLAWVEARCGANAADAVEHARRAVGIKQSSGDLDTLAEAYFAAGDRPAAAATAAKALALDPTNKYLQEQSKRFQSPSPSTTPTRDE